MASEDRGPQWTQRELEELLAFAEENICEINGKFDSKRNSASKSRVWEEAASV